MGAKKRLSALCRRSRCSSEYALLLPGFAMGLVHIEPNPSQPPFFKGRSRLVALERVAVLP
jgi:hypothetical protein